MSPAGWRYCRASAASAIRLYARTNYMMAALSAGYAAIGFFTTPPRCRPAISLSACHDDALLCMRTCCPRSPARGASRDMTLCANERHPRTFHVAAQKEPAAQRRRAAHAQQRDYRRPPTASERRRRIRHAAIVYAAMFCHKIMAMPPFSLRHARFVHTISFFDEGDEFRPLIRVARVRCAIYFHAASTS